MHQIPDHHLGCLYTSPHRHVSLAQLSKGRPHLNIVNVNCQSASAKRLSLERLIGHQRPDIVIGTESWLHAGIGNQTIFPTDVYQVFRRDREGGNTTMGGVFILAGKELTVTREEELETDCELLWCRVEIQGSGGLHIAAYYRPNEKDEHSLDELASSTELRSFQEYLTIVWL